MKAAAMKELCSLFTGPMYVYTKTEAGMIFVDKIEVKKDTLSRDRYSIIGSQCTCLSHMKTDGPCKHLKMMKHEFGDGYGASKDDAVEVLTRFTEMLKGAAPTSVENWEWMHSTIPDPVNALVLRMAAVDAVKDAVMIAGTCKTPTGNLGVVFDFSPTKV